jgi:ABC-type Zn uptake system ZnuABC Zn-binding protein ZnuA
MNKEEHQSTFQHAHSQEQDHGEFDPHVWFDVQNVIAMVIAIRDVLVQVHPAQAQAYHTRTAQYTAALRELDAWILAQVHTLPSTQRKLVTSHHTFGYFAQRYGFTVAGTAITSFGTDEADPSAGEMATLVETIKALRVPAVFSETILNPRLMQRLAAEAGVTLAPPLYTDALGAPGTAGGSYLAMMRYNVTTIVRALQP